MKYVNYRIDRVIRNMKLFNCAHWINRSTVGFHVLTAARIKMYSDMLGHVIW